MFRLYLGSDFDGAHGDCVRLYSYSALKYYTYTDGHIHAHVVVEIHQRTIISIPRLFAVDV